MSQSCGVLLLFPGHRRHLPLCFVCRTPQPPAWEPGRAGVCQVEVALSLRRWLMRSATLHESPWSSEPVSLCDVDSFCLEGLLAEFSGGRWKAGTAPGVWAPPRRAAGAPGALALSQRPVALRTAACSSPTGQRAGCGQEGRPAHCCPGRLLPCLVGAGVHPCWPVVRTHLGCLSRPQGQPGRLIGHTVRLPAC